MALPGQGHSGFTERTLSTLPGDAHARHAEQPQPVPGAGPRDIVRRPGATALADDAGPVVAGLVNAGDSLIHTDPTFGHGVALGPPAARRPATHTDRMSADALVSSPNGPRPAGP